MRALLQRVSRASVRVDDVAVASIGPGLVILLGVGHDDDDAAADTLARRIVGLRIFRDAEGRTNRSILETGGDALVVSQFTLFADTSRGRRPGFTGAAPPGLAERLYERVAERIGAEGVGVVAMGLSTKGRSAARQGTPAGADRPTPPPHPSASTARRR